ncbi:MAG: hypothetical protein K0S32_3832 [Bacteroidetes bacterium]|jgi:predicted Zn-dependent protease|nr:hypothetical protein [Bacteroidota bacterium]
MRKISLILLISLALVFSCKKKNTKALEAGALTANDFLSSSKYTHLTIEFVYERGYPPAPESLTAIQDFLQQRLNKPSGISVSSREINASSVNAVSLSDIINVETKNRQYYPDGNSLSAFIYLANADYIQAQGNFKVLGIQYDASSIVLFGKTMREHSGGIAKPPYKTLETSVALHELGHVLGLVNNGSGMTADHQDDANGHHCNNKNCLMYYAVETTDIVSNLLGGSVPALDVNCLNDLKANGGK